MVRDKNIVLGVTGSIAVYKAVEVASKLTQEGAKVDVVMTKAAQEFVTPLTFRAITNRPVATEMFDPVSEFSIEHVTLAARADLVVIAPATANVIAKLAGGIADDMLGCTVLATKAPIIVAPAMDANMYQNQITQQNIARLKERGFTFVGPGYGRLATGEIGLGRLADIEEILGTIRQVLGRRGDLAKRRIVVSAGGTQEPMDPVRHISNRSSGKMGYAIAEAARDRGASVVLVSGPTALHPPVGVEVIQVQTAVQMRDAIVDAAKQADALLMAAAVSDYRPAAAAKSKIKKERETLSIELVRNPDILSEVRGDFVRVGFAAESENVVENAKVKLKGKNLDLIVANDITATDSGFGVDTNRVLIVDRQGKVKRLPLLSKLEVAHKVLDRVVELLPKSRGRMKKT
ncbi:Coenzyme A biosynthesis bifunctional protein CoaBC [subsurface metagenome]